MKHLLQELALTCHKDPAGTIRHDDNETTIETQQNQTFYVHSTYIIIYIHILHVCMCIYIRIYIWLYIIDLRHPHFQDFCLVWALFGTHEPWSGSPTYFITSLPHGDAEGYIICPTMGTKLNKHQHSLSNLAKK